MSADPPAAPSEPPERPGNGADTTVVPTPAPKRHLARTWRITRSVLGSAALLLVFATSAAGGLLLHVDLPAGRRVAATLLTNFLSEFFYGSIDIGTIEHIDPYRVRARDIEVKDVYGKSVLRANELTAHADIAEILRQIFFGAEKESLVIRHVRVEQVDVELITDPTTGEPTLARAFTPVPSPPSTEPAPSGPSRYIRVWLPTIEIGRAYGRGKLGELPTLEAQVVAARGSVLASPKGAAVDVERFGATIRGLGGTDARGTGDVHVRVPGAIWVNFDGYFGDVALGAFVRVDGDRLRTRVDLPKANPDAVRALWPAYPLHEPANVHAEAAGKLPNLDVSGVALIHDTKLSANGSLRLDRLGADLDVEAEKVDLRAVWPDAPKTAISGKVALSFIDKAGQLVLDVNGTTKPTQIAGQDVPAVDLTGTLNEEGFIGKATLHEDGMPVKVGFTLHPGGAIDLDAHAKPFTIQSAPRVARLTGARGRAELSVKAHIADERIRATGSGNVQSFALGDLRLASGKLNGTASGPLKQPEKLNVSLKLNGQELKVAGFSFEKVSAEAKGPVTRPSVKTSLSDPFGPSVDASGLVSMVGKPRVDKLELEIKRRGAKIGGRVASVNLADKSIEIKDLSMFGEGGNLSGSARIRPDLIEVRAKGENVDLDVVSRILGLPRGTLGGKLRVDADISAGREVSRGRVRFALGNGSIYNVGGVSARVNADLSGRTLTGDASVLVQDFGSFGAVWNANLDGPVTDDKSWQRVTGQTQIQMSNFELSGLEHLLPAEWRIDKVRGQAFGQVQVSRKDPEALPSVSAIVATRDLSVSRAPVEHDDAGVTGFTVSGINLQTGLNVDGESGYTNAMVRMVDQHGVLGSLSSANQLELWPLVRSPETALDQLAKAPVQILLELPERDFRLLPEQIRPTGWVGTLGGRVTLTGSVADPTFNGSLSVHNFNAADTRLGLPMDLTAAAQYELKTGAFGLNASAAHKKDRIATLQSRGVAHIEDLTADNPQRPRWTGTARLMLEDAPLGVVAPLADARVDGRLQGSVTLTRNAELPQLFADVTLRRGSVDLVPFGGGKLNMRSNGRIVSGELKLDNRRGKLDAKVLASLDWDGIAPAFDSDRPTQLDVTAEQFDANVLAPLLKGVVTRLDGELNARLSARLKREPDPSKPDEKRWTGGFNGSASMTGGVVQLAVIGLELRELSFSARAVEDQGLTRININEVSARAREQNSKLTGNATLFMDGVRVTRGTAAIAMEEMPLMLEGVSHANGTGTATVQILRESDHMSVKVAVPDLVAEMPRTVGRSLVEIDPNESIAVIQPLSEPSEPRAANALPWHMEFDLGNVRVLRNDIVVPLRGRPVIDLKEKAEVTGYIELKQGGSVPLLGKVFRIESGRIAFDTGDPKNPHINVVASWRAPEATVYVEVRGTLDDAELHLRSDPARPESEVTALLLGGGGEGETTFGAAQALGLDELFADTPLGNVEFRADTSETDAPSYTAAVRISDELWLEGIYRRNAIESGSGSPGQEGGSRDAFAGAIDWRFRQNWSLRTEAGQTGTAIDLLWQYRY